MKVNLLFALLLLVFKSNAQENCNIKFLQDEKGYGYCVMLNGEQVVDTVLGKSYFELLDCKVISCAEVILLCKIFGDGVAYFHYKKEGFAWQHVNKKYPYFIIVNPGFDQAIRSVFSPKKLDVDLASWKLNGLESVHYTDTLGVRTYIDFEILKNRYDSLNRGFNPE